jgi:hypothetical protein
MSNVYDEWAKWLVCDTGAPWNWRPDELPPAEVLKRMPKLMYDHDNRRADGSLIHPDVTVEDYLFDLCAEWGSVVELALRGA